MNKNSIFDAELIAKTSAQPEEILAETTKAIANMTSVAQLVKHTQEALYRGRWVALLTSMHTCFLNQSKEWISKQSN